MPRIALEKFPEQVKGSDSADSTLMRCALLALNRVEAILHGLPQAPQPPRVLSRRECSQARSACSRSWRSQIASSVLVGPSPSF